MGIWIILAVIVVLAVIALIKVNSARKMAAQAAAEREYVNARIIRFQPNTGWILEIWHENCWKSGFLPEEILNESFIGKRIKVSLEDFDENAGYWQVRPMMLELKEASYVIRTGSDEYIYPAKNGLACVGKVIVHKGYTVPFWTELPLSAVKKMAKLVP